MRQYTNRLTLPSELAIYGQHRIQHRIDELKVRKLLHGLSTYYQIEQPFLIEKYLATFLNENRTEALFDIITALNNGVQHIYEYYPNDVELALFVDSDPENDSKKIFVMVKTKQSAKQATDSLYATLGGRLIEEPAFVANNLGIVNEPISVE